MKILIIQGKIFKQYKETKYFCNEDGIIYSDYSQKILNPMLRGVENKKYPYIDINFGAGQKHCYIHKIVFETWIGEIPDGLCVLHRDDNQFNNNVNNLYLGTIKDNTKDRINNNHNVGNIWSLTVYDNKEDCTLTFCPASNFIHYSGHPCGNRSVNKLFERNWFKKRYKIIDYSRCKSLEGVTTMADECKPVEQNLSLLEAHRT